MGGGRHSGLRPGAWTMPANCSVARLRAGGATADERESGWNPGHASSAARIHTAAGAGGRGPRAWLTCAATGAQGGAQRQAGRRRSGAGAGECAAVMGPSGSASPAAASGRRPDPARAKSNSTARRVRAWRDTNGAARSFIARPRRAGGKSAWPRTLTTLPPPSGWWSGWGWRPKMQALVRELSTGERQRLGLARALVKRRARCCWDEPTAALDPDATACRDRGPRYLDEGGAALLVTHSEEQARRLCRRAWRMRQGKLETLWT